MYDAFARWEWCQEILSHFTIVDYYTITRAIKLTLNISACLVKGNVYGSKEEY